MEGDTSESARASVFIEKIDHAFTAADAGLLRRAYAFSRRRMSGFDSRPFKAAELLVDQRADAITVACALIAPLLWQGRIIHDEIPKCVDQTVAAALRDFNAPTLLRIDTENHRRSDINTLLSSLAETPRKALLLIAFRLVELEEALASHDASSGPMAQETLHFYVPIANRLSLGKLRRGLEDVCFHILDPDNYEILKRKVAPIQAEDDRCLELLIEGVRRLLVKNCIHAELYGRTKSLYGIHAKMIFKGKSLEEIMDRVGLRVIVASVPECYAVLGLLHTHFKPIPNTFNDYIGLPKDNGYQSLHTCVYPVREISHKPIEFQVRTELMHREAEHGAAAHWLYKGKASAVEKDPVEDQWVKGLVRQHEQAKSAEGFIETLHRQVYEDDLVVFGKGGRITRLPDKATVLDYLNLSNTRVSGSAAIKVNGKIADLERFLRDGDSIEIIDGESYE